jgi:hypothetical protein
MDEIRNRTPEVFQAILYRKNRGTPKIPRSPKKQRRYENGVINKRLEEMKRWLEIANALGWIGIAVGDWIAQEYMHGNVNKFRSMLGFYTTKQQWIIEQLSLYWPQCPDVLVKRNGNLP